MADYKPTMFIIEFINGKLKKWDDDKFKLEMSEDGKSLKVFSRITKEVALDVPNTDNILYIHYNIVKRDKNHQARPFNGVSIPETEYNDLPEDVSEDLDE